MKHIEIKDEAPLISIVVPAYNAEKYIGATLNCATKQTIFPQVEVIVVNDGSTDSTRDIITKFLCYRNFRLIDKPNGGFGGPGDALNVGHQAARGKYITWWSADNIYFSNFCDVFAGTMQHAENSGHNVELMYSDFCYINAKGQKINEVIHQKPQNGPALIEGYDIGMSFMYTKALWEKTGPFWTRICEDYQWAVRAAQHTNFGLIRAMLAAFRVHDGQISGHRQVEEKAAADDAKKLAKELFSPKVEEDIRPFENKELAHASC